jgi:uncharacterized protein with von Willebrand factor type A (vWA) domain
MAGFPDRFRPDALEARLRALDGMPRTLWLPAIVNNEGDPFDRVGWVDRALGRLVDGVSPLGDVPPAVLAPELVSAYEPVFARLDLAGLSCRQQALAEQVLRSLLWHVDRIAALSELFPRHEAIARSAAAYEAEWQERGEAMREVMRLVESLDGVAQAARWSELQGLLQSSAWQAILEASERVARMPQLAELIRRLGRVRPGDLHRPRPEPLPAEGRAVDRVLRERDAELPGAPIELEGVGRSGDLSRMLPTEAVWRSQRLGPERARRMRRLFAAKLAEHTLLGWQHREHGSEPAWWPEPGAANPPRPVPAPEPQAGPIILCVDTSASMAGGPEQVAKAVVVQALRVATAERRRCHVVAFSGAGQVIEQELSADLDGLLRVGEFVSASFHGGTDMAEPVERALARVRSEGWQRADLLIASDGEFGPTPATVAAVEAVRRELGLRVQGILIGDRETRGMRSIVDDTFWVRDWRRYGGRHAEIRPPVHDRNLTGLYFPNIGAAPGTGTPLPGMRPVLRDAGAADV